jgi:F-type H+-transporting ATPase subunit b
MNKFAIPFAAFLFACTPALATEDSAAVQGHAEAAASATGTVEHAAEGAKGGLPQFDPTWFTSQLFWIALTFAVLYFFFSKKTIPALETMVEGRKQFINEMLTASEDISAQALSIKAANEERLNKAIQAAGQQTESAEKATKEKQAAEMAKFRTRYEQEIAKTETSLNANKQVVMAEMNNIAAEVAGFAAEKLAGIAPDQNAVAAIIDDINKKAKAA